MVMRLKEVVMNTIKERFNKLLETKEKAKTNLVQLETKRDSAKEALDAIEKEWKENWGINSYEEAQSKISEMEQEIESTLSKCEEFLEKVGV